MIREIRLEKGQTEVNIRIVPYDENFVEEQDIYSVTGFARKTHLSRKTIHKYLNEGIISKIPNLKTTKIHKNEILKLIEVK